MTQTPPPCAVAIVGRPNVGKSAIFNRLCGRRTAIVHAERGVTRDRLVRTARWGERRFDVIDTGGLGALEPADDPSAPDTRAIERGVRRQVDVAVRDAAAIILVVDIATGLIPQDEEVAAYLRRRGRPVFLAVNKADTAARDAEAADFARLGFPVFPVSAAHDRGFDPLMTAVLQALPPAEQPAAPEALKVTIAGRPNVGKSSLINRLLNDERVLVSSVPGTTRDSIDIPFTLGDGPRARHYLLTDTAGMRRAGKIRGAVERLSLARATRSIARADVVVLMLDAAQGPTEQDKKIGSLIVACRKSGVLFVNKWDAMHATSQRAYRDALMRAVPFLDFMPIVFGSARTGENVRRALDTLDRVAARAHAQLPTGALNRTLAQAVARQPPPAHAGRRLKLLYATQTAVAPLTLTLFVNHPDRLTPAYASYLIRTLRAAFDLEGAPVLLVPRARRTTGQHPSPASGTE